MKSTINQNTTHIKLGYNTPEIKQIKIDNDISLALSSEVPPTFENEGAGATFFHENLDPYKTDLV